MSAYGMAGRRTVERSCRFMSTTDPKKSQMTTQEVAPRRGGPPAQNPKQTPPTEAGGAPRAGPPRLAGRQRPPVVAGRLARTIAAGRLAAPRRGRPALLRRRGGRAMSPAKTRPPGGVQKATEPP